jgi:ATP-dependent RNA helicase RhlE
LKFADLELRPELLEAVESCGYTEPTPIQQVVIPQVLKGKDVSGLAQTGTGKTAAFVIPLIDRILCHRAGVEGDRTPKNWKKNSYVLVLVPTRELATQVEATITLFGQKAGMKSVVIVGGSAYDEQRQGLRKGVEFVVGTPGRLLDLYKSHDLDLNGVAAIVFDEADRMFDMGFKDDMKFILRRVPRDRQFLLFSATLNFDVLNTSYQFGAEPIEFNVSRDSVTAEGIEHEILHVGQEDKPMYLLSVLKKFDPGQCIVFSNFKYNVSHIAKFLKNNKIEAIEMSSLLSQHQRNKVLESFKSGKKQILVATDVAARGLDVKGIDLVVNFDLPDDAEGYVHRIGRTGRAGGSGKAVGLVSDRDVEALGRIETYLKEKIKIGWLEDSELLKEFAPFTREERSHSPRPRPSRPHQSSGRPPQRNNPGPNGKSPSRPAPNRGPARPQQTNTRPMAKPHVTNGPVSPQKPTATPVAPIAHGQTAGHGAQAVSHQHRDRKLGRHGGINNASTGGSQNKPQNNPRRHSQSNTKRPTVNSNATPQRRPLHKDNAKPGTQAATVGKKIKGFFSKLFK